MVADMGNRMHQFVNGFGPHLIDDFLTASVQEGMDIPHIQAHAQNLEERQQQQRSEREHDKGYNKRARSLRPIFKASGSQYRGNSGQMRPPLPRCTQCGKLNWGKYRLGSNIFYPFGLSGHIMRDCQSRGGRGMVHPTRSAADSSSSVRPPRQSS
ncbi:uncharacterized protein LOC132043567 [Lycium ferocissimum]|uniref:uncharacterized protein LOC132043567 n=1 Tax=Lycium ferocissimum TaxID=112874 RepID=UPI002814CB72|nr:uncharacterized protein LOC132043567 [Lycium ferocissimum]